MSEKIFLGHFLAIEKTKLNGVLQITPPRYGDSLGFSVKLWNARLLADHGISVDVVRDNQSLSSTVGTVRGLHFQSPSHAQDKLVRRGRGRLLDIAVDIRKGSPSYGEWVGVELSAENGKQLLVPKGFLHGFVTLEPDTEILYKCSDYYAPECDGAIRFDDPDIAVDWGIALDQAMLSEKDVAAPLLKDFDSPFIYEATQ